MTTLSYPDLSGLICTEKKKKMLGAGVKRLAFYFTVFGTNI